MILKVYETAQTKLLTITSSNRKYKYIIRYC